MDVRAYTVGDRIKQFREAANLKLAETALVAGITASALSQIENGVTKNPKSETLFKLADALGVDPRFLVFGHHDRVAPLMRGVSLSETARMRVRQSRRTE